MATGLINAQANTLLGTLTTGTTYVQLHKVGEPGAAGTTNVATEADRMPIDTWASAANGSIASAEDLEWTSVAGTEDYLYFSAWTLVTAGACKFTGSVVSNPVTAGDTFTIPSGSLTVEFDIAS